MKILVANDRTLVTDGLRHILKELGPGLSVLEARSIDDALDAATMHPDVALVLIGFAASADSGIGALTALRSRRPELSVMLVLPNVVPERAMLAFSHGAKGYIAETVPERVFLQAVRLVMNGGVYVPRELLASYCSTSAEESAQRHGAIHGARFSGLCQAGVLTPRQAQVLELMAQGKSNKVIGRELSLAPGTVKAHVSCVLRALKVDNRTEAVVTAAVTAGANTADRTHLAHYANWPSVAGAVARESIALP